MSVKTISIAVLEPLKIYIGQLTVLFRLYIAHRVSSCCLLLRLSR